MILPALSSSRHGAASFALLAALWLAAATEDFRRCLATDVKTFLEHRLARGELKALAP